jgi:hypothetical protein
LMGVLVVRIGRCAIGEILHGSAMTMEAVRRAISSQESLSTLAKT